jgi:hypothetical protein
MANSKRLKSHHSLKARTTLTGKQRKKRVNSDLIRTRLLVAARNRSGQVSRQRQPKLPFQTTNIRRETTKRKERFCLK